MAGIATGMFSGHPDDFGDFFRDVIRTTYNYGFGANFGKMMVKTHSRLAKQKNPDYLEGRRDGLVQAATGDDRYLAHRLTW